MIELLTGDCLIIMRGLDDESVDSIVTDPPYGISFMGKRWDYDVPDVEVWEECLRVLKPGGFLLAFAGTRTHHRMVVNIEDAGFEIRDMIAWVYGSGFPKSLDVSKAIDKVAGAEREFIRSRPGKGRSGGILGEVTQSRAPITAPATDAAKQWDGWGTALKPALEPITVARKPLEGTVAENVMEYGTGAMNIDGCRVPLDDGANVDSIQNQCSGSAGMGGIGKSGFKANHSQLTYDGKGRWPANFIHDGSDEVVGLFPKTGPARDGGKAGWQKGGYVGGKYEAIERTGYDDDGGSTARFFYTAKASAQERASRLSKSRNPHPTVKPLDLMAYLCRLVTPPGGTILDPFMGSGSTGIAALRHQFKFIGIEREEKYVAIARRRIREDSLLNLPYFMEKKKRKRSQPPPPKRKISRL